MKRTDIGIFFHGAIHERLPLFSLGGVLLYKVPLNFSIISRFINLAWALLKYKGEYTNQTYGIMTTDIAAFLNTSPPAPAQTGNSSARTSDANDNTNATQNTTQQQNGNNTTNQSNANGNAPTQFSQLLANKQSQNASQNQPVKNAASDVQSATLTPAPATQSSASNKNNAQSPDLTAAMALLAQLLAGAAQPTQIATLTLDAGNTNTQSGTVGAVGSSSASGSSTSGASSGSQAVQAALAALASALTAAQPATSQSTGTAKTDAQTTVQAAAQQLLSALQQTNATSSGNGSSTTTQASSELAAIQALLAAASQTNAGAPTTTAGTSTNTTTAITADTSSAAQQVLALLSQLADGRPGAGAQNNTKAGNAANTNTTNATASSNTNSAQDFADIISNLLQNTSHSNVLANAVGSALGTQVSVSDDKGKNSTTYLPVSAVTANTALSSTSSTASADAPKFTAPASVPAAEQVLLQIKNGISDGSSQIKIQLNPQELGKVTVQLNTTSDGKTGVTITADNRQTLSALQSEAKSLQAALRDVGIKTDSGSLSFNLRDPNGNSQQSKQGGFTQVNSNDDTEETISPAIAAHTYNYSLSLNQGLDIRV